jgi:hypothetical protein
MSFAARLDPNAVQSITRKSNVSLFGLVRRFTVPAHIREPALRAAAVNTRSR